MIPGWRHKWKEGWGSQRNVLLGGGEMRNSTERGKEDVPSGLWRDCFLSDLQVGWGWGCGGGGGGNMATAWRSWVDTEDTRASICTPAHTSGVPSEGQESAEHERWWLCYLWSHPPSHNPDRSAGAPPPPHPVILSQPSGSKGWGSYRCNLSIWILVQNRRCGSKMEIISPG